jgi:DNA-binding beta-propeller fold protein YncE
MTDRPAVRPMSAWIAAIVVGAVVVGGLTIWRMDRWGDRGSGVAESFPYDIERYRKIDPAVMLYDETGAIAIGTGQPCALAVDAADRIYVAADGAIQVFERDGKLRSTVPLKGKPYCLAVAGPNHAVPGRIYVGIGPRIEVLDGQGKGVTGWRLPGEQARPTSIALAAKDVFVADFAGQIVLRFDTSGRLLGRIGQADRSRGVAGLAMPSPFCDVAVAEDGLLWVANPAALRLQAYTFDGKLEMFWGDSSSAIDGFFGCCNPAHFAILPDGDFVTAEKGLLRVKVYSPHGTFVGVVAGPEQLDSPGVAPGEGRTDREYKAVDVAADSRGRVLVLDMAAGKVRVFERKRTEAAERSQ